MGNFITCDKIKLNIEVIRGRVNLDVLIKNDSSFDKESKFNPRYNCIIDLRDAEIELKVLDLKRAIERNADFYKNMTPKKVGILVEGRENAALAYVFTSMVSSLPVYFEVYSSLEGALKWVEVPHHFISRINDRMRIEDLEKELAAA